MPTLIEKTPNHKQALDFIWSPSFNKALDHWASVEWVNVSSSMKRGRPNPTTTKHHQSLNYTCLGED